MVCAAAAASGTESPVLHRSMPKSKEENSDDLEITSIGALYKGPWDKKYWSSSRGKDRYPYPIGYQALRTHNGIRYKMEIHEGSKGPSFVIISADGVSYSGQTPDITWEVFQKKGCSRVKTLHGKKLSCKTDGVEFFGFRNPFVQRLLRELVANINGTAEQSFPSASPCCRVSGVNNETRLPDSCTYPDLLPYLVKPQPTGKRSRKQKNVSMKLITGSTHKRLRLPEFADKSATSRFSQRNCNEEDGSPSEIVGPSDHHREEALVHQEDKKLVSFENCMSTRAVDTPSIEEKPLDSSKHSKVQGLSYSAPVEDKNGETTSPENSQGFNNAGHCAPDAVDHMQDNTSAYASNVHKDHPDKVKDELAAVNMAILEGPRTESHMEGEMGTYNSNENSERSDFDSFGQEVAKSMMTVLLPQALPLLKKTSRKEKATNNHSRLSFCREKSLNENNGACPTVNDASPALVLAENFPVEMEEKVQTFSRHLDPVIQSIEHMKSVVPDSFEDDQCGHDSANGPLLFSDVAGADQASFDEGVCASNTLGQFVKVDAWKEPAVCLVETSESIEVFSCTKANVASELDENPVQHGILSEERGKKLLDHSEDTNGGSSTYMVNSVQILEQKITNKMDGAEAGDQNSDVPPLTRKCNRLLSESIVYRNSGDDCILDAFCTGPLLGAEIHENSSFASSPEKAILGPKLNLEGQPNNLSTEVIALNPEQQNLLKLNRSHQKGGTSFSENNMSNVEEFQAGTNLEAHITMEAKHKLVGTAELVGCYVHPMPILSVSLSTREDGIHICVVCGLLTDKHTIVFIYKVSIKEPRVQSPTFIGYARMILPTLKGRTGQEIALDRCGLQFTPDGQSLVLLNSIKTPYCREQKIPCLCSTCKLECFEENAIKIVQVKLGYLSVVGKLKTVDSVRCILVCAPNHLVAVEDSGKLHVWVMNSTWSVQTEDFILQTYDCISPSIVELKKIPNYASLVIGHHGMGEFSLWDISRRTLISRFAVPDISIFKFIPISMVSFQSEIPHSSNADVDLLTNKIMASTKMWLSKHNEDYTFLPLDAESIAVWLLVSTPSEFDTQLGNQMNDFQANPVGRWRLALLVKNMVILGNTLEPRAAAIGASAGHGILGTHDGLVYMWELSTGTKLGCLHYFKGSVSCVATDDSRSGVFAVAGDGGELLVYVHPQNES